MKALEGVAMVHGMGQFRAFLTVTLPLIKGGVLSTALFIFILNWSEFLFALVLTAGNVITVTLQVANYVSASSGKLFGSMAHGHAAPASVLRPTATHPHKLIPTHDIFRNGAYRASFAGP